MRSWLCASSLRTDLVTNATRCLADIAHFDLEDSVPEAQKDSARCALGRQLSVTSEIPTAVRINRLSTLHGLKDLLFLLEGIKAPDIVILPKAALPGDVAMASALFVERQLDVKIFAIVEGLETLWALRALASAPRGLAGLIFGSADMAAELGIDRAVADFSFIRQELVLAAKRFGVEAIDSPCFSLGSDEVLVKELQAAVALGFSGKIAIHPSQVRLINEFFTPSCAAVERAKEVVAAHAQSHARSIFRVGNEMVGPPTLRQATDTLTRLSTLPPSLHRRGQ